MSASTWGRGDTKRRNLSEFPPSVLAEVDRRQGGRFCVHCRELALVTPEDEPLELDHKQPLSQGGDNSAFNLQWLCRGHNRSRGNRRTKPAPPPWARGAGGVPDYPQSYHLGL